MKNLNPYLQQVWNILPRIFALYDTNPVSSTFGIGDRYRWAWKLIDFANGTFQGAANGLSQLLINNLLPKELSEKSIMQRIDAMFIGTKKLIRSDGSLEEAFPYESSFCVTALVAYDLLKVLELLSSQIDANRRNQYVEIIRPMINFLHKTDETHAFISNHLAAAVAALYKWTYLTHEDGEQRGFEFLRRILREQSSEGWFREYEGADPGYQTLCIHYLADIHKMRPDLGLIEPLQKSIRFLWHFAHPDGSFGGIYGSRNTRFYFPSGIEVLSDEIPEAKVLATFMRQSIDSNKTVTLYAVDEPNLIPMFNSYCYAAVLYERSKEKNGNMDESLQLPCISNHKWQKDFKEAGLLVDKGDNHYTIVSYHKGGVCYHYVKGKPQTINTGVVIQSSKGKYYSTQAYQKNNTVILRDNQIVITSFFTEVHSQIPSPLQFVILRVIAMTIMRNRTIKNFIKKLLVRLLITGRKTIRVKNERKMTLGEDIQIVDTLIEAEGYRQLNLDKPFSGIHMASQGYWQKQDDSEI